jgi:hypothetical protein
MADELQLVTTNAASDGWVDGVPGAVSTGYQAQNTVLQALFNGLDKSSVRISGANLIIDPSGVIDDSGLPFVVQSAITLALPTTGAANWFLKVVAGSTALERSIEFTDDRGTYDASKNGFYNTGGERVLNWCYNRFSAKLVRLPDSVMLGSNAGDGQVKLPYFSDFIYQGWLSKIKKANTDPINVYSFLDNAFYPQENQRLQLGFAPAGVGSYTVSVYNPDGTLDSTLSFGSALHYSVAYDEITDQLIIGTGAKAYVKAGLSTTAVTNFAAKTFRLTVDSSGNLIGCESGSSVITRYTGISGSVLDSFDTNALEAWDEVHGLAWDFANDNLVIIAKYGAVFYIVVLDGFSNTVIWKSCVADAATIITGIAIDPITSNLWQSQLTDANNSNLYIRGQVR